MPDGCAPEGYTAPPGSSTTSNAALPAQRTLRAGADGDVHPRARARGAVHGEEHRTATAVQGDGRPEPGVDVQGQVLRGHEGDARVPVGRARVEPVADRTQTFPHADAGGTRSSAGPGEGPSVRRPANRCAGETSRCSTSTSDMRSP
ncbi:hypothetical protein FM21_14745 [Streptomyces mutabilis]|uniref:Uncharacterized protein n=1 Tax=Streptomyces mutabilis TaxID=67332 RepID=A0A086N7Y2_9ACTN|nr:hypothetical protein FM21_14745 [Streptomyces mutabilis]